MYMVEDDVLFIMNDGSPAGFRLLHLLHLLHSFIVFTVFHLLHRGLCRLHNVADLKQTVHSSVLRSFSIEEINLGAKWHKSPVLLPLQSLDKGLQS